MTSRRLEVKAGIQPLEGHMGEVWAAFEEGVAGRSGNTPWAFEQLQEPQGWKRCYRGWGGGVAPSTFAGEAKRTK